MISSLREVGRIFFNNLFFIHFIYQSQPPLLSLLQVPPLQTPSPFPPPHLRGEGAFLGYHPTLGHPVPAQLGTAGRRGPMAGNRVSKQHLLHLLGLPHEDQAVHLPQMCRGLRSSLCTLPGWWPSLCKPPDWLTL